ncbi:MAG TPA: S8 family serine peptidase, partial [Chloroflexota bacterium]|nr:S8 family serine peptidase [Chloroflexota bacterium]
MAALLVALSATSSALALDGPTSSVPLSRPGDPRFQAPPGEEQADSAGSRIPGHFIVVFDDDIKRPGELAHKQAVQRGGDVGVIYHSALKGYAAGNLSSQDVNALREDPRVSYVVPDYRIEPASQTIPTGVQRIRATENETLDIDGVDDVRVNADVAVIDTGIDFEHPDLNVVSRTNCVPPSEDWEKDGNIEQCVDGTGTDGNHHGTHVAGTIGAIDNDQGVVGVAPGVRLWAVKVLSNAGSGASSWLLAGIDWVTAHSSQIEVANMSLDGFAKSDAVNDALKASLEQGVVYVAAAGNGSTSADMVFPGGSPYVITVAALSDYDGKPGGVGSPTCQDRGPDETPASFSNWGPGVDIMAPGVCIYSTLPGGKYGFLSGTSMASPHVAGAAAMLASKSNPNSKSDVEAIRKTLINGGSLDWNDTSEDSRVEPLLYADDVPLSLPEVETGGYSANDGATATLTGSVSAHGQATEYYFEYGTTTEYGQSVPSTAGKLPSGTQYVPVSATISGIVPGQTYHYRLVTTMGDGNEYGEDAGIITGRDKTITPSRWTIEEPATAPERNGPEWLNDVSCPASGQCMAVGYYYKSENLMGSYRFSNGSWNFVPMPTPAGGIFPEVDTISCTSPSACTAVGKVQMPEAVVPLAERWNGTSWSIQPISGPAGSPYSRLASVSCPSPTECVAAGYFKNPSGAWTNYSARWAGGSWSGLTTPVPAESVEGILSDVSCPSVGVCTAVGWYMKSVNGIYRPVVMAWNGSSWNPQTAARKSGSLDGVMCTSAVACVAVGHGPVVEKWN